MNRDFVTRGYIQDTIKSDSSWIFTVLHHFATRSDIENHCKGLNYSDLNLSKYRSYDFIPEYDLIKEVPLEEANPGIYFCTGMAGIYSLYSFRNPDLFTQKFFEDNFDGIAVITNECRFVIRKKNIQNRSQIWGADQLIVTMDEYNTPQEAKLDYNGYDNTEKICNFYGEYISNAASSCLDKIDGGDYLGSAGEMYAIYQNLEEINKCLIKIGADKIDANDYYWTSTQTSSYADAWAIYLSIGSLFNEPKDSDYKILPLSRL